MQNVIITLVGKDRPGIVETVATFVFEANGNWLSSSLSKMAGQFAGIIQVQLPAEKITEVEDKIEQLEFLQCLIKVDDNDTTEQALKYFNIDIMGNDKPGIIQEVSAALAQVGASVVKLQSSCEPAPNWGGDLFKAHIVVAIDEHTDSDHISDRLEAIANDLVVELDLVH